MARILVIATVLVTIAVAVRNVFLSIARQDRQVGRLYPVVAYHEAPIAPSPTR